MGETAKGKPHGRGVLVRLSLETPIIIEAWFKDGLATGRGRSICEDGGIYEGSFRDGKHHGQGKYRFPNGDCYAGEISNDKAHGQGTKEWVDGRTYIGSWRSN